MTFEEHTADDFERLFAVNVRGVFFGCKHAVVRFKEQGGGGVSSTPARSPASSAGAAPSTAPPRAPCTSSPRPSPSRRRRTASASTRSARRAMPLHRLHGRRRHGAPERRRSRASSTDVGCQPPARQGDHRRGLRRGRGVPRSDEAANITGILLPSTAATSPDERPIRVLDRERLQELFDLRASVVDVDRRRRDRTTRTRAGTSCASRARCTRAPCTSCRARAATSSARPARARPAALLGLQLRRLRRGAPQRRASSPRRPVPSTPTGDIGHESSMLSMNGAAAPALPGARAAVVRPGQGQVVDRATGSTRPSTR